MYRCHLAHQKACGWGVGSAAELFHNLDCRWRWSDSRSGHYTPWQRGPVPIEQEAGWAADRSERCGIEKTLMSVPVLNTAVPHCRVILQLMGLHVKWLNLLGGMLPIVNGVGRVWRTELCGKWCTAALCVLRAALCWVIMQRLVVISYRHLSTTYRPHLLILDPWKWDR
jgi:hypothetical protein